MKKLFAFIIPIIVIILFIISIPLANDYFAKSVLRRLEDLPLPLSTEYIESISKAGKLVGNGNGMQYFGAILIKSDLSTDELNEFYSQYRQSDEQYIVCAQIGQQVSADIIEHDAPVFTSELIFAKNYYIVYSWGSGVAPFSWLDIRGN